MWVLKLGQAGKGRDRFWVRDDRATYDEQRRQIEDDITKPSPDGFDDVMIPIWTFGGSDGLAQYLKLGYSLVFWIPSFPSSLPERFRYPSEEFR